MRCRIQERLSERDIQFQVHLQRGQGVGYRVAGAVHGGNPHIRNGVPHLEHVVEFQGQPSLFQVIERIFPVFELALMQPLWARVYIDESHLGQIAMGQSVEVTVDSFPNERFSATVGFISSVAEFTPKTVQTEALRTHLVYEVRLTVDDPQHLLRLGMPVTAKLIHTK